jgi:hypothetical protein
MSHSSQPQHIVKHRVSQRGNMRQLQLLMTNLRRETKISGKNNNNNDDDDDDDDDDDNNNNNNNNNNNSASNFVLDSHSIS